MTPFFEKLGEMTNNKYNFIKLREALVDKDTFNVVLNFVIPPNLTDTEWNSTVVAELESYVKDILPSDFNAQFRYTKSILDEEIFIKVINDYIKDNYSALIGQYDMKNIKADINNENNSVKIIIPAYDITIKYCTDTGLIGKLTEYLNRSFCASIKIEMISIGKPQSNLIKKEEEPIYIDKGVIYVKNRVTFQGQESLLNPKYIANYTKPTAEAAICGRLSEFERKISKKGYIFYTFTLDDSTGSMRCVAFSRSKKKGAYDWLLPTDEYLATFGKKKKVIPINDADVDPCLVVEGEIVEDTYKKGLTFIVNKASCCRIDFNEIQENRAKSFVLAKRSHKATPIPYSGSGATDLFDLVEEPCPFILNNNFVVFDLETTGLDTAKARIIELGAVKVEHGEITSYYNTLVDPKMPIPKDASSVNHIEDSDVIDAPYIEDCLGDFMDYCKDCILVAHNGDNYDFKILRRECYDNNIPMDNRLVDSLTTSRKAYPEFPNHKLDTLCKKLNVDLANAHRAYFDAEATAKVFIKMCNKMKLNK